MKKLTERDLNMIRGMDDASLFEMIKVRMADLANQITWLAAAIHELTKRNSDIAEKANDLCKSGFWLYLPLVAQGKVSATALATFSTREDLLAIIAQMPIEQQDKYATNDAKFAVEVFNPLYGKKGQTEFVTRDYKPYLLPDHFIPQVFDTHTWAVRDQTAQQAYLRTKKTNAERPRAAKTVSVRTDSENMLLFVDGKPVGIGAVVSALAKLAIDRPEVEEMFKKAFREIKQPSK